MSKIAPKLVEEMQLSWDYGQVLHTDSGRIMGITVRRAAGFGYYNCILTTINDDTACTINSNGKEWRQSVHGLWTGTIGKDDRSNSSDDLHECISDSHVSVMTSQCDTNLFAQINKRKPWSSSQSRMSTVRDSSLRLRQILKMILL